MYTPFVHVSEATRATERTGWRWLLLFCVLAVYGAAPIHLAQHSQADQVSCPLCVLGHTNAMLDNSAQWFPHPPPSRFDYPAFSTASPVDAVFVFSSRAPPIA